MFSRILLSAKTRRLIQSTVKQNKQRFLLPSTRWFRTTTASIQVAQTDESEADEDYDLINEISKTLSKPEDNLLIDANKIVLPRNINSFKLGKLIDVDPLDVFHCVQEVSTDICTDEFQILSDEAIELVCLELLEKEVKFIEDDINNKH